MTTTPSCLCKDFSPDCAGCGYHLAIENVKDMIIKEMNTARSEGQPTSRLTSLFNKL